MAIAVSDLQDLITTTQKELGELKWTEIATDLQEHTALSSLLQESRVQFSSGTSIQWNIMVENSGLAKDTSLFATDEVNIGDVMKTAEIGWKHQTTNYAIERREIAFNRDPRRIVDLVAVRRADAMISMAEHMEKRFWGAPTTDTDLKLNGVGYWVSTSGSVPSAGSGAFAGGDVFSAGTAGLSSTTYPRWQNWWGVYTAGDLDGTVNSTADYSNGDSGTFPVLSLTKQMREAYVKTGFKPIANASVPSYNTGDRHGIYCGYNALAGIERIVERTNDKVTSADLQPYAGRVMFRGVPITYVPHLDSNATNDPIYMLNWGTFHPVFLEGEYMREMGPDVAPNQHTTLVTHIDCTLNAYCTDRRRNAVLSTAAVALTNN
tara:strand:+ start:6223 stop:7353 length:1131 start_codon:yes stop_codon:yes gene_type:complete